MKTTKSDSQNSEELFVKMKSKDRRFTRKENCKKVFANGIKLRNRFASLEDEDTTARHNVIDEQISARLFFIGKKSIFKGRPSKKLKLCTSSCDVEKFEKMMETNEYSLLYSGLNL